MSQFSINKGEINKKIKKLFVIRLPSSNTKDLGCDIIKELNILSPYKRMFFFFYNTGINWYHRISVVVDEVSHKPTSL